MKNINSRSLAGFGAGAILLALLIGFVPKIRHESPGEGEWGHYGHDASNNKFSPLSIINTKNVSQLKQVWSYQDSKDGSSILFNPLIVKGKMFAFMPSDKLVALEPATGKRIWEFSPDSTDVSTWTRGVTFHAGKNGRPDALLFVFGSTLYSINASTGKLIKDFGDQGKVDFYTGLAVEESMKKRVHVTANAPGVIFGDLFIVGCKVPDELPSTSGDVRAFNVYTGKLEWVFHTIPKEGEFGYTTWPKHARQKNGGANCWGGMALDEKLGIVYVPTASPSFDFYGADREGENLFANCLLALDAKTGKRLWHFQTTHHDLWDRDNGSPPNLVQVKHDGKLIDGVALVTKMGYVFLFDRKTGKPLFQIDEVPVPTKSEMPGEKPWPTQPIPTKPRPFSRQGFKPEYFSTITPEVTQFIKDQIAENKYNTGIYEPPGLNGSLIVPAAHGGANWGGASYNPNSGVMFVNAVDMPWFLQLKDIKSLKKDNEESGENLFKMYCSSCHGADQKGTNFGADISLKVKGYVRENLAKFIQKGAEPMPSFQHLPQQQIDAITAYLKGIKVTSEKKTIESGESGTKEPYGFSGYEFFKDPNGVPAIKPPFGTLNAIDLNSGEILWQVPLGVDKKLAALGIKNSGLFNRGGGIATGGGLIFIGATVDQMFRAFDQKTGKILWEKELPGNATSVPSTFSIGQKQYITVSVSPDPGKGYKGGYITFSLE